jgi:hypothetical protein
VIATIIVLALSNFDKTANDLAFEAGPLIAAHGICTNEISAGWEPVADNDPYFSKVRTHWNDAGKRQSVSYQQTFFAQLSSNGDRNGTFVQFAIPDRERERMVKQKSCVVHVPDGQPPLVSKDALAYFAGNAPTKMMIGVAHNETTWVASLRKGMGYDYVFVTTFDPKLTPRSATASHPFRGTQYRFQKREFLIP